MGALTEELLDQGLAQSSLEAAETYLPLWSKMVVEVSRRFVSTSCLGMIR